MEIKWVGPYCKEGGITQSLLNRAANCPYQLFLYLGLGLKDKEPMQNNLMWGDCFHKGIELLVNNWSKPKEEKYDYAINGMLDHLEKKWPEAPKTFQHSLMRMLPLYPTTWLNEGPASAELVFCEPYTTFTGRQVYLKGKMDINQILSPGTRRLGEHKCKGEIDPLLTMEETPVDLQVLLYSRLCGATKVMYDLIRIPDQQDKSYKLPVQKSGESVAGWVERWFSDNSLSYRNTYNNIWPIKSFKMCWIQQIFLDLDQQKIDNMFKFFIDPMIERLCQQYELWTSPGFDPENPENYGPIFYRNPVRMFDGARTERFKCNYHKLLTGQQTLADLEPLHSFYSELEEL